jgi:uracil-DNA glycosylase family 4
MPEGFFAASKLVSKAPPSLLPRCGLCQLDHSCRSPKMPYSGEGRKRVLIVGEAPGAEEDKQGIQFVGKTGQRLERELDNLGVDMRRDCWLTNSLICRPEGNEIKNKNAIEWCRPNLLRTLRELEPEVVLLLGAHAVTSMIGHVWKEDPGGIGRWAGWVIPCQKPNVWICPTYHPSFVERSESERRPNPVPAIHWRKHLRAAFSKMGKPWDPVPDYAAKCIRLHDDEARAVELIQQLAAGTRPVAFDYETNSLKPQVPGSTIVSASLSDGRTTFAFPWRGKRVIAAFKEFILSPAPKIASNMKFEEIWTWSAFGHGVNNWYVDTMQKAHVQDCRPKITSIKFQAFVHLGAEEEVRPFLESKKGQKINRILEEVDLDQLLLYNAMDSLLEWLVARKQVQFEGGEWPS